MLRMLRIVTAGLRTPKVEDKRSENSSLGEHAMTVTDGVSFQFTIQESDILNRLMRENLHRLLLNVEAFRDEGRGQTAQEVFGFLK